MVIALIPTMATYSYIHPAVCVCHVFRAKLHCTQNAQAQAQAHARLNVFRDNRPNGK